MINLDHNATTSIHPEVVHAMQECWETNHGNPASSHRLGRRARQALESSRDGIGQLLGAEIDGTDSDHIILTSGGTEANNLALLGLVGPQPGRVIISAIEHPSVAAAAEHLRVRGHEICELPVSDAGIVQIERLDSLLTDATCLVSIMLANNETGVIQPVAEAAHLCQTRGIPFHTDAVQAVGKIPVDFRKLHVTALSLSGHKFHGPHGIGALIVRHGTQLQPILYGGHQQKGLRPGTQPLELAIGLHRALQVWKRDAGTRTARMTALRDQFEELIRAANVGAVINGLGADRLPNTSNVAFPGLDCQAIHMALDLAGVASSIGAACASGAVEPSPVLLAMKLHPDIVEGSLRFSLGAFTTRPDIESAAARLIECVTRMRS
jgi:cysteine desulfurase